MHRGRRYPQIVHRWACPDFDTTEFAPITLQLYVQVFDTSGFGHDVHLESHFWDVDPADGLTSWRIPEFFVGLNAMAGEFWQDMCGTLPTRKWHGRFEGDSGIFSWTLDFGSQSFRGYGPGPPGSVPPDTSTCTGFWDRVSAFGMAGKPYH